VLSDDLDQEGVGLGWERLRLDVDVQPGKHLK
jgi:hypothetical protein